MNLEQTLLKGITRAAGKKEKPIAQAREHGLEKYWTIQYFKMAGSGAMAGIGGFVTGAVLSVGAAAFLLRCVANMTYAYGDSVEAQVDTEDFHAVLAIWMGTDPDDIIKQSVQSVARARAPMLASRAAERVVFKISEVLAEKLAVYFATSLAARIAAKLLVCAVPLAGAVVMTAIITQDYNKIKSAIRRFYAAKQAAVE